MDFDDRGRLWVTQTVEYPFPEKDGKLKGQDAVKVLEDFGPDGKAHKITTFADDLDIPIGVLPLLSAKPQDAIVYSIPSIWRLRDTDGDGKADERTVLYTKYGHKDTHGMTGNFTWGFDGWVYACHGFSNESTVKGADGKPVTFQSGNVYRFRPDGSHLEYVTHGQVNPFGLAFDPLGDLYSCDCETKPIAQLLRGGCVRELRQAQRRPRLRPADDRAVPRFDGHRRHRHLRGRPLPRAVPRRRFHRRRGDQPRQRRSASPSTRLDAARGQEPTSCSATTRGSGRSTSSWGRTAHCTSRISIIGSSVITRCRWTTPAATTSAAASGASSTAARTARRPPPAAPRRLDDGDRRRS